MKHVIIVSFLVLGLYSCQDTTKKKQLAQLDQLIETTDSLRTVFIQHRNDSILYYITKVMDVEFRIRRSYVADTINLEFGKKMNAYKQVRKKLKPIIKMNYQVEAGSLEELATLKKLKNDIKNGLGDRTKYEGYINFEKKKIKQIATVIKEIRTVQEEQLANFNRYHQELYDFSMTLEHVVK